VKIGEPAVPALIETLKDGHAYARKGAAQALGAIALARPGYAWGAVAPALVELLNDKDSLVRDMAADALVKIGGPAIPELIGASVSEKLTARRMAALYLRMIRPRNSGDLRLLQRAVWKFRKEHCAEIRKREFAYDMEKFREIRSCWVGVLDAQGDKISTDKKFHAPGIEKPKRNKTERILRVRRSCS
jgi:hypothetical protein